MSVIPIYIYMIHSMTALMRYTLNSVSLYLNTGCAPSLGNYHIVALYKKILLHFTSVRYSITENIS